MRQNNQSSHHYICVVQALSLANPNDIDFPEGEVLEFVVMKNLMHKAIIIKLIY